MSLSNLIDEQLAIANVKRERFREILVRLMAYGVIVRDEDKTEQLLYDDARRVESLLDEYLDFAGFRLYHDRDNQFYRLYAAGAVVDGLPTDVYEPTPSLRARVSPDFVALALTLRFLYQNKLNTGDIQPQGGEALVSFEEIAATMQTQLKRALPSSMGDKMALLADLRRHRLLRYAPEFSILDEDALLAIRPTILGVVSNEALTAALDADGVFEQQTTVEEKDA
ncbi:MULTISPECIES: DUF4194 domain-containing protein [Burkholderia]|jgi:hypothetical protein|uniref:DUF4194 domain-containing protein n=2 Tax=Burkholderia contaminans TaxID=488447 RepID=A0A1E3FR95_9BURK|nr:MULTISPECIES: DUF4194 domain-containing protein [Burkholderia]KKL43185.1 hypothetical protein WR31_04510 [Burkholderia contaminans LMG 23361]MBA9832679.1 DUF4194 domain-containing protein [Burkholderia contaminans]MBA9840968.1 DUF4194 domain-containing protein [Burkholderia contaminans]MBA9866391.1 DUF4194 domain-containing protein [Burkholderia contaminans]MBA9909006.1 DUF4194 domain-containing protein [Burkholderia contaminans]